MTSYADFLANKNRAFIGNGIDVPLEALHPSLMDFQRHATRWALRKGRSALFLSTGLGKSFCQLAWADQIPGRVLILAPLAVAQQTVGIAERMGIPACYVRNEEQAAQSRIAVTNYEMVRHFNPPSYAGVVLDEASIIKSYDGETTKTLLEEFSDTSYRLACTATPAPNDAQEFANYAAFLGIMSRQEMLASFFIHDSEGWRLKGHARQPFYKWLSSWSLTMNLPSDLGYEDNGFILPELSVESIVVPTDYVPEGRLFATGLKGITDRTKVRRGTLTDRVITAANCILAEPDRQWIAWCDLNEEAAMLTDMLPDAIEVRGNHALDEKVERLIGFTHGDYRVLVTKKKIAAHGLNLQNATRQVFVGMNDSAEQYWQAIRRSWRFGQKEPVGITIIVSELETPVLDNVLRKEREMVQHQQELIKNVVEYEKDELAAKRQSDDYREDEASGHGWVLKLGDSAERLRELESESIDLSIHSPPFSSLYTYSNSDRDLGNCSGSEQFLEQYRFIIRELLRVTKPGREALVHVQQVATTLAHDGVIGLTDFRGDVIRAYQTENWVFHGEITVDKNPQVQAQRTKAKALLFVQKNKDSSWSRPALADYVLIFRRPGENRVPVVPDVSNDEWIQWAHPVWYDIRETDTLNVAVARENEDERHIAPLQLSLIERCIRLWSNPGETVLDPFAGIGSTGVVALRLGRRAILVELKATYWRTAKRNLDREQLQGQLDLFSESAEAAIG